MHGIIGSLSNEVAWACCQSKLSVSVGEGALLLCREMEP
jgi:hypothetical protein